MRKARKQSKHFFIVLTILVLLGGGVAIALNLPSIISYRNQTIDSLIQKASASKKAGEREKMFAYLKLAQDNSFGDNLAFTIAANEQVQMGRYDLAVKTLDSAWSEPNHGYIGYLALKAQDYSKALAYFKTANRRQKTTRNLAGLSRALMSLGKTREGCEKNDEAIKNNLSDKEASAVAEVCKQLLSGKKPTRELAYMQIGTLMYGLGEHTLLEEQNKIASDWLLLARIAAARGDLERAIERVDHAITLDDIDPKMINFAATIYKTRLDQVGNNSKDAKALQDRLNQLNTKFQHLPNY